MNTTKMNTTKMNTTKMNTTKMNTTKMNTTKINTTKMNTTKNHLFILSMKFHLHLKIPPCIYFPQRFLQFLNKTQ